MTCISELRGFRCVCREGFTSKTCEVNINECASSPCNVTGTMQCLDQIGDYKCDCKKGFKGKHCEIGEFLFLSFDFE